MKCGNSTERYICRYSMSSERKATNFTYEELLTAVKNLSEIDIYAKKTIVEEIKAESENCDYNVWKQVLKDIG